MKLQSLVGKNKTKVAEWIIACSVRTKIYQRGDHSYINFNRFDFINNAGNKSGANVYFGVSPAELKA